MMSNYPPQPVSSRFGINVNALSNITHTAPYTEDTYEAIAQRLRQANIGWVRMEFNWGAIIGHDADSRDPANMQWADTGCGVDRAVSRGINVLGGLEYTPDWAVSDARVTVPNPQNPGQTIRLSKQRFTPDDIEDWKRFVQAAVTTFPDVHYWSIWNEPNSTNFFYGDDAGGATPQAIAAYNRLIAAAAPIIHASGG